MRRAPPTALALLLLVGGCDGDPAPPPAFDKPSGAVLYEQVFHTWPAHNRYELDHQLVVRNEDPVKVMSLLDIRPGMTVCDIGCGSGFYTTRMAEAVGSTGVVHAIDIQQDALDYLADRLAQPPLAELSNIRLQLTRVDDCELPEGSIDRGLLTHADFYAYEKLLDENLSMLASLYRAIRPGGALVIVQDTSVITHTDGAEVIVGNLEAQGFVEDRPARHQDDLNVYLRFLRPDGAVAEPSN